MSLPQLPFKSDGTQRSFWERPEGGFGIGAIGAMGLGAFVLVKLFGGFVLSGLNTAIEIVGKGIVLGGLAVAAFLLWQIVTSPKVQALVSYGFKLACRWLLGQIIELDPIGIMRIYIDKLREKLAVMEQGIEELNGQIVKITRIIAANKQKYEKAMSMATHAQREGIKTQLSLNARKAGRAQESNVRYEDLKAKLEMLLLMLRKYKDAAAVMIEDMSDEVDHREVERKAMLGGYKAMKSAKAILAGSDAESQLYDQAMEFAVNDYGMKMGEIENFMETSRGFVEGLDLENGAFDADALEKIQAWEAKADSLLLGNNVKAAALQGMGIAPLPAAVEASSYTNLINHRK